MSPAQNRPESSSAPSLGEAVSHAAEATAVAAGPADELRARAVRAAVELFERDGFEATSVAEIAAAAGISRATFFRQVGGKEDAVFADHAPLLERLEARMHRRLADESIDPHAVVCEASLQVFTHLAQDLPAARRRYAVVRSVPALREREIVTERRYERLFVQVLRAHLPQADALGTVVFAAAVTAAHNHALRSLLRDERARGRTAVEAAAETLGAALDDVRARLTSRSDDGLGGGGKPSGPDARDKSEASDEVVDGAGSGAAPADAVTIVVATLPSSSASGAGVEAVLEKVRDALS